MNRVRTLVVTLFTLVSAFSAQSGRGFPFLVNPDVDASGNPPINGIIARRQMATSGWWLGG
jgi:hypothetical protein